MEDDETVVIGPKIPQKSPQNQDESRLISKLNHFFDLKISKGLSLNQQLASRPDFHAPGITESLLDVMKVNPWGSNLSQDVAEPFWEAVESEEPFDYIKVAQNQRLNWEAKNQQIMNATTSSKSSIATNSHSLNFNSSQMPRKRI